MENKDHLAWHETLEMHEIVAFQSNVLTKIKKSYGKIDDEELRSLYIYSIKALEKNLKDLLPFYGSAPGSDDGAELEERIEDTAFYAGDLLGAAKTSVRSYSIAITETATKQLRDVFTKHLLGAIQWHEKIFTYMNKNGYYPAYDLHTLLMNDVKNAEKAIKRSYKA